MSSQALCEMPCDVYCIEHCYRNVVRPKKCATAALQECQKVAQDFPTIEFNSMIVDNTCMQLTGRPDQFDVMVRCHGPLMLGGLCTRIIIPNYCPSNHDCPCR